MILNSSSVFGRMGREADLLCDTVIDFTHGQWILLPVPVDSRPEELDSAGPAFRLFPGETGVAQASQ